MKKMFFVFGLIICFFISGCGKKEIITKCNMKSDQSLSGYFIESNYKVYSKKNVVTKVEINEEISSEKSDVLSNFKSMYESQYDSNNNRYGGYSYKMSEKDGKLIIDLTIDYSKMNIEKFVSDNAAFSDYLEDNKLTLDGIKKMYKTSGIVCE